MKQFGRSVVWMVGILAGCAPLKATIPGQITARSEELPITERSSFSGALANEGFRIGPYAISAVDRKWDSASGWTVGSFTRETTAGGYSFAFEGAGKKLEGKCVTGKQERTHDLGGGAAIEFQNQRLGCACQGGESPALVEIAAKERDYSGTLSAAAATYTVHSIHELDGGPSQTTPTGYRVESVDAVAAVDAMGQGRVWLDKKLSESARGELSCLIAGLLLYKPKTD